MRPAWGQRAAGRFFYLSHGLVWLFEIELTHMAKNNGNPDLVCENAYSFTARLLNEKTLNRIT